MTIYETILLAERAKIKNDGVYSYKGHLYAVKDNKFIAFSDYHGNCHQRMGAFNVSIGKVERYDRKRELLKWLKKQ